MGYTTEFQGQFNLDKALAPEHYTALVDFADERHEETLIGKSFGYYCQWVPNKDGTAIKWDGGEKFYDYKEWIVYLIDHFLKPWGYTVNGEVEWSGEDISDLGKIIVKDNVVTIKTGKVVYK